MAKNKKNPKRITTRPKRQETSPFVEHVYEFRRRLIWIMLVVVGFAIIGYNINDQLVDFLLRPAKDQEFIYTTPGGGLNFIIQISIYFGIVVGIPVIIYHILRYLEPLLSRYDRGFIMKTAALSAVLALAGMAFGYYVALPAALIFLGNQFHNDQITALLTLNDYLSFVTIYMLGIALMFQIPIILLFVNRVKPLSAKKLAKSQRWVILIAFIAAAIITPTPDLFNQAIIALPIILIYQVGVVLVASQNKYSTAIRANRMRASDQETRDRRQQAAAAATKVEASAPLPEEPTDQAFAQQDAADSLTIALQEAGDETKAADSDAAPKQPKAIPITTADEPQPAAVEEPVPVKRAITIIQEDTDQTDTPPAAPKQPKTKKAAASRRITISQAD